MKGTISWRAAAALLAGALAVPCTAHAQPDSWAGPYLGVTGVYAFTNGAIDNDYDQDGLLVYSSQRQFEKIFGGVRAGYNFAITGNLLLGVESDLTFSDGSNSAAPALENRLPSATADRYGLSSLWGARVRLGVPAGAFLPYVSAGIVAGRFSTGWDSVPADEFLGRGSGTAVGYSLGAGVEYAVSPQWRVHAGYRFADFGTSHIPVREEDGFTTVFDAELQTHAIVFGVTYAFGPRN
jgi:outer membrane immunogenic protein